MFNTFSFIPLFREGRTSKAMRRTRSATFAMSFKRECLESGSVAREPSQCVAWNSRNSADSLDCFAASSCKASTLLENLELAAPS